MVEVQKLRTFLRFLACARVLCGDSCGQGSKTEDFFAIFSSCARPSAQLREVEVQTLRTFLRLLLAATHWSAQDGCAQLGRYTWRAQATLRKWLCATWLIKRTAKSAQRNVLYSSCAAWFPTKVVCASCPAAFGQVACYVQVALAST